MKTKIILDIEEDILKKIVQYAFEKGKTLNELTIDLYKQLLYSKKKEEIKTPIAKKYKGILKKKSINIDKEKLEILKGKHII